MSRMNIIGVLGLIVVALCLLAVMVNTMTRFYPPGVVGGAAKNSAEETELK